jgi:hypothetical protein
MKKLDKKTTTNYLYIVINQYVVCYNGQNSRVA